MLQQMEKSTFGNHRTALPVHDCSFLFTVEAPAIFQVLPKGDNKRELDLS